MSTPFKMYRYGTYMLKAAIILTAIHTTFYPSVTNVIIMCSLVGNLMIADYLRSGHNTSVNASTLAIHRIAALELTRGSKKEYVAAGKSLGQKL